jgi:outer membrane protein TolC
MKRVFYLTAVLSAVLYNASAYAQKVSDSLLPQATLQACIQYALTHQPVVKQAQLDEDITEYTIKGKLADWYPQVGLDYNLYHYLKVPTSYFNGNYVQLGVANTSGALFQWNQNLFNRDLLLAGRTARDVRKQAKQNTESYRIDVVANVTKAYFDLLLTQKQIDVLNEDIVRLERSLRDAYNQYQGGLVDKTDYKRATISLNNTRAQKKTGEEQLKARDAYLRELMGYPVNRPLPLVYDTAQMAQNVQLDTTMTVTYANRIEMQLLQTQRVLLEAELKYNKWSFLPTVSAFANYNFNYLHPEFSKLYNNNLPSSQVGLRVSLPIFQGSKRIYTIRQSELQLKRTDLDVENLRNQINTEYTQAMATYKSNLNQYYVMKENVDLAQEVYNLIELQYREGIKTYLEVITAQTDLRSAQLNYYNAMYTVLSSKVDLQRALGTISTNNL